MERLSTRIYIVAALLFLVGAIVFALPKRNPPGHDEKWMEELLPTAFASVPWAPEDTQSARPRVEFRFLPAAEGDKSQSYRMDAETYQKLAPLFGIVCRDYARGPDTVHVVVIASNSRSSFHDPRVCFAGQGWDFDNQTGDAVPTQTRGSIPITLLRGTDASGASEIAAYFYKGPKGFSASTVGVKWMLLKQLVTSPFDTSGMGVFYRFIATDPTPRDADAKRFEGHFKQLIADYMDAAGKSSGGYF